MSERDLERFITSKMRGDSAPLESPIIDNSDPRYLRALEQERRAQLAADVGDEDDEEFEAEPELSLEDFTLGASLAMGFAAVTDEEIAEAQPLEGEDVAGPPAVDQWWASLSEADQERVREGTADEAQRNYAAWAAMSSGQAAERGEDVPGEPMPQTGAQFVAWAEAHADEIRAEFDMSVDEYVASMARASAPEWRRIANASGIPFEAKPSYSQLGRRGQTELLRADLADSFERMKAQGRHIE